MFFGLTMLVVVVSTAIVLHAADTIENYDDYGITMGTIIAPAAYAIWVYWAIDTWKAIGMYATIFG